MENPASIASKFINSTDRHVFLTGKAGTGKTTFLKSIIGETHKKALIVAPTGIAAINAGGVTIHSLFQLPFAAFLPERGAANGNPRFNDPSTMLRHMQMHGRKRRLIQELELLIVDEVSMLRADILDAMDTVLRSVRKRHNQSFGGVQVLFIGDLLQLPPVVKEDEWQVLSIYYPSIFFFDAKVLRAERPFYIELDKIYRQSDETFINLLNNLRTARVTPEDISLLNSYYKPGFKSKIGDNYIHLTTHNSTADSVNRESLKLLPGKVHSFRAKVENDFPDHLFPVEHLLELKLNAQVMFIKNDLSGNQRYFNGKIGKVTRLGEDLIEVSFDDGSDSVSVERYTWENVKYDLNSMTNQVEERVAGTFLHYPLKLAWAITVHKSQGLTFSKAIVDIGQAFAPGQVYVALSRLRSLDGLVLTSMVNLGSLRQDASVSGFSEMKNHQELAEVVLKREATSFLQKYLLNCFDLSAMVRDIAEHVGGYTKDADRSVKQKHEKWAMELQEQALLLKIVADRFRAQVMQLSQADEFEQLSERVKKAVAYFIPILKGHSKNVLDQMAVVSESKKVKTYLGELQELEGLFYSRIQHIQKAEALVCSVLKGEELKKDHTLIEAEAKQRKADLEKAFALNRAAESVIKKKKEKVPKGQSKQESYHLYKSGLTIPQIAAERKMTIGTIEKHLQGFVQAGELDVEKLVPKERIEKIVEAYRSLDTTFTITALKEKLGSSYTYQEIRFVLSSRSGNEF